MTRNFIMKKIVFTVAFITSLQALNAQIITKKQGSDSSSNTSSATPAKKDWKKIDLSNRGNDHLMVQYGFDNWAGTGDSINTKGFSRFFNAYAMLDKPFKTNPKYSVGLGLGVGSSNIFFNKSYVNLQSLSPTLPFSRQDSSSHFKKFKLTTIFLEAPVELRYSSHPENSNKSVKFALGVKVGTLLNAHTKGKTLQDKNGNTLNTYIEKESSKRFINSTRIAGTVRIGYGIFGLYGAYQITSFLKTGAGPSEIRPYSIGLYISGL